jgi:hypothetical protein
LEPTPPASIRVTGAIFGIDMPPPAPAPPRPTPPPRDEAAEELVDLTLIDEMLAMTVVERLHHNDRVIRQITKLRAGFAALEPSRDGRSGSAGDGGEPG